MRDRKKQLLFMAGRPFAPFYGGLMRLRELGYAKGMFRSVAFPVPVISVGNLVLGGSGKTPLVQYLARLLRQHGYHPAVVSRGYGGATREPVNVVSDGEEVLLSAEFAGDEPRLLAETLPGVKVLTGVVRKLPARRAVEMGADVLLLDDGFQHLAIRRNLDLVLFSANYLAGNSRIFPGGDLREPVAALGRASCFVLTGVDEENRVRAEKFSRLLEQRFPEKPIYFCALQADGLVQGDADGHFEPVDSPFEDFRHRRIVAVSGIACPQAFVRMLRQCGLGPMEHIALPDHHVYRESDMRRLEKSVARLKAEAVVTTEKDLVKLRAYSFPVPLFALRVTVSAGPEFDDMVLASLRRFGSTGQSRN